MNSLGQIVWHTLHQARWLPSCDEPRIAAARFVDLVPGEDLLPRIVDAWSEIAVDTSGPTIKASPRRSNSLPHRVAAWARHQRSVGACLTCGLSGAGHHAWQCWNGDRLIWWPRGVPSGRRVGLISSHLGRRLHQAQEWFEVLRAACAKMDPRHEVMVTAVNTTTHKFARRAAHLFDRRLLILDPPGPRTDCRAWLNSLVRRFPDALRFHPFPGTGCYEALVSPPLHAEVAGVVEAGAVAESVVAEAVVAESAPSPLADRLLMSASDQLRLLHLRRRGKLLPLVRRRLADAAWRPSTCYVALGPRLVPRELADELLGAGAVGWLVGVSQQPSRRLALRAGSGTLPGPKNSHNAAAKQGRTSADSASSQRQPTRAAKILVAPPADDSLYLTHCTRAAWGAWPDQDPNAYLDELILSAESADHSALAALKRIMMQQQILATATAIRGATPLVSFTEVPLRKLQALRTFRVHRGRWDFEPYGISIRRDCLAARGARPVVYGDQSDWTKLDPADRPFFQLRFSQPAKSGDTIDWSREREWRIQGHVDLAQIDPDAVLAFVPTREEAAALLPDCRWPIVVLDVPPSR